MGIMRTVAAKGLIPAGNKVDELRGNITRLITNLCVVLEERLGQEGLEILSETFRQLGEEDASAMKVRLGLDDTLDAAADAWKIMGHILGVRMVDRRVSDGEIEFSHPFCPQYKAFREVGKIYCEHACLPYVGALATTVAPSVKMRVVRAADSDGTCVKSLITTG